MLVEDICMGEDGGPSWRGGDGLAGCWEVRNRKKAANHKKDCSVRERKL